MSWIPSLLEVPIGRPTVWIVIGSLLGTALIVVVWGDCSNEVINFLERFISPLLKPVAGRFGLDQGDLFRSASGACRTWWADSVWVAGVALVGLGATSLLVNSYKRIKRFLPKS